MQGSNYPNIGTPKVVKEEVIIKQSQMGNPHQYPHFIPQQNSMMLNNSMPIAYPNSNLPNMPNNSYPNAQLAGNIPGYPNAYDLEAKGIGPNQPVIIINQQAAIVNKTGTQRLDEMDGLFIRQKLETLEVVTGCETENRYYVYAMGKDGKKKSKKLMKAKERSNWCARNCLSGACRPYHMQVSTFITSDTEDYAPFLSIERPCKCTCLCFSRPYTSVTLNEGGRTEYIGKIQDPWKCCDWNFNVYDRDNVKKYVINGSCCQLGVWCKCPCEPCQTINFDIKTASGEIISSLQHRSPGCLQAMASDADNYALKFPPNITPIDKALLMSAVLFLDYRHFESRGNRGD